MCLEAVKTWGDTGQNDQVSPPPASITVPEGHALVVSLPEESTPKRMRDMKRTFGLLKTTLGWKGQILVVFDDVRLEVIRDDEAKRLLEKQTKALSKASKAFAGAGISAADAVGAFKKIGDALRTVPDAADLKAIHGNPKAGKPGGVISGSLSIGGKKVTNVTNVIVNTKIDKRNFGGPGIGGFAKSTPTSKRTTAEIIFYCRRDQGRAKEAKRRAEDKAAESAGRETKALPGETLSGLVSRVCNDEGDMEAPGCSDEPPVHGGPHRLCEEEARYRKPVSRE